MDSEFKSDDVEGLSEVQEFQAGFSAENSEATEKQECRDFKRNVCKKGSACKYYHPPRSIIDVLERNSVCHDFQNKRGCNRLTCRYLHLSKEEELYIRDTGKAPSTIGSEEMAKLEGLPPLCNDYLQGRCNRGHKCKFRHVGEPGPHPEDQRSSRPTRDGQYRDDPYSRYDDLDYGRERHEMRRRYREDMMEDEIMYLRAQVSRLKRQVADLTATNEMLMDENARLHVKSQTRPAVAAAAKLDSVYGSVSAVAPAHAPIAQAYGEGPRSTASGLVYGAAVPRI